MFKLLKDLAKGPEPLLSPSGTHTPHSTISSDGEHGGLSYRTRSRSNTLQRPDVHTASNTPLGQSVAGSRRESNAGMEDEETDEDAKKVVKLLAELSHKKAVMEYVDTYSQILGMPGKAATRRAFRRHSGFRILVQSLAGGLAWSDDVSGTEEEKQVKEVQRMEGVRLSFELLAWAQGDRDSSSYFERAGGYHTLLPKLYLLSPQRKVIDSSPGPSSSPTLKSTTTATHQPNSQILALLVAHLFSNNYTALSIFNKHSPNMEEMKEKAGELNLRFAQALPLLLSYMFGIPSIVFAPEGSLKGKEKATACQKSLTQLLSGLPEDINEEHDQLIRTTLSFLIVAAEESTSNLLFISQHLPGFPEFLLTRLYGKAPRRDYAVTFYPTYEWAPKDPDEEAEPEYEWTATSPELRKLYLRLLTKLLEAGVTGSMTWRLFSLVREESKKRSFKSRSASPFPELTIPSNGEIKRSTSPQPFSGALKPTSPTRRKAPGTIKLALPDDDDEVVESLNSEVLGLVKHAMKHRWPSSFVFQSLSQAEETAGLELKDMGRQFPKPDKGFSFSCYLNITKLNHPLLLLDASQALSKYPFLQIKILENSLIAINISPHCPLSSSDPPPEDIICQAPDALIPHGQWVHFAVNMRQLKGNDIGEVRLYINGARVGVMKIPYPTPVPPGPAAAPQLGVKAAIPPEAIRLAVGKAWSEPTGDRKSEAGPTGRMENNAWFLGRAILMEETVPEDIILLMYHLGPRYSGNFQEALGKFLTYQSATAINIYLHSLARNSQDKKLFSAPATATLAKAIRTGPALAEENILLSIIAKDIVLPDIGSTIPTHVINGAVPHPSRAKQLRQGTVRLTGSVDAFFSTSLDETFSSIGGGTVLLKMIDLAETGEELETCLEIFRDSIKANWAASEEIERIRGFDLLAAILRPKMFNTMTIPAAKVILGMLGVNVDKPGTATVHNSVAYRALGLDFELWSGAPLGVISIYLQHFENLLISSRHARYNMLRTFQKSSIVRKILFALRSSFFEQAAIQMVVDTLRLALISRWNADDSIKPVFSFLVTALCQGTSLFTSPVEPPPSQVSASLTLLMMVDLMKDETRLIKLNRSLALHRLMVIFISSNSSYYVILPCLEMLKLCLTTQGMESFQRSFENEGGFALLGKTLPGIWRADIQELVFSMLVDPEQGKDVLTSTNMVTVVISAIETLLSTGVGGDQEEPSRPGVKRSLSISSRKSFSLSSSAGGAGHSHHFGLDSLLQASTALYHESSGFRRAVTTKRVESMIPHFADFAAMSATGGEDSQSQRKMAADWLGAISELSRTRLPNSLLEQISLIREQLQSLPTASPSMTPSTSFTPSSPLSRSSIPGSLFGTSFSGRMSDTPAAFEPLRRRPSTEAGIKIRSVIEKRIPLQRTLTGESILEGGKDKNAAWKLIIIQTDLQGQSKMTLERKEHWQKLGQQEWPNLVAQLREENAIWPQHEEQVFWRLDGSEGPLRQRNRLERISEITSMTTVERRPSRKMRDAIPSADELSTAISRMNVAPWEDPFALALGEANAIAEEGEPGPTLEPESQDASASVSRDPGDDESFVEVEEQKDDKMRRIAKTLQAGDIVEQAHNIVRIVGVDACPGLLILGRKNLYLIDGLVHTAEGDIIDAKEAPKDVLSIPSGTLVELDPADQLSLRWSYNEIVESNKRAFLFRDVALELYFSDKRNFLIVCKDARERSQVISKLQTKDEHKDAISRSVIGNFVLDQVARATEKSEQQLNSMTRRWMNREISNFAYLQLLNQHANRTPNDVTQYPVFPWVIADYRSNSLEFDKESTFRNLALPMGALTPARQEAAVERYSATEGVGEVPFHFGTHYSSSMIVCGFLIRVSPFTEIFLALQGGNFDLADRLFSSVPKAWDSASSDNRGDVRELIPEFYYNSGFLLNINHHDFGRKQGTGEIVDKVALPPWALNDPSLFIHRQREALESDYVSKHLGAWIDLTFGYKQRDPASFNCFHPLSYKGAVDLDRMKDESEKAASTAIIHNFGQTPRQVFLLPHPQRYISPRSELPMGVRFGTAEQWQLLIRSILPITELAAPIDDCFSPGTTEEMKPTPLQKHRLPVPNHNALTVQYGFTDDSIRVYYQDTLNRLIHVIEGVPVEFAVFANTGLLATISPLGTLTAWRMQVKGIGNKRGDVTLQREATLRGSSSKVTCVTASKAWSFLVTGHADGSATVWDTNRLRYVRTIETPRLDPIKLCAVHDCDGKIALASSQHIYVFSLNGAPIASTWIEDASIPRFTFGFNNESTPASPEYTGSISFLNREFLRFGPMFAIGVGSEIALYRCVPGVKTFDEVDPPPWSLVEQGRISRSDDHNGGDCTMVKFIGETLYGAFKPNESQTKWSLYQWSLPETNARHVPDHLHHSCMTHQCGRHFGLLEPKRYCGGCGGAFCGTHCVHVETMDKRYCEHCRAQLASASARGVLQNRRDSAATSSRRNSGTQTARSAPGSRRGSSAGLPSSILASATRNAPSYPPPMMM